MRRSEIIALASLMLAASACRDATAPRRDDAVRRIRARQLALADVAPATQMFYGPERFTRTAGAPDHFSRSISTLGFAAPFALHVRNGAADGSSRISSAHVVLDGVTLLGPNDFNQNQEDWTIPVTLGNSTTLQVQLASAPGSFLDISLTGRPYARFCPPVTGDGLGYGDLSQAIEATAAGQTIWVCDGAHIVNAVPVDKPITIRGEHSALASLVQPASALGSDAILNVNGVSSGTVAVSDLNLSFTRIGIHTHGTYDQLNITGVTLTGPSVGVSGRALVADSSTVQTAHVLVDQSSFSHGQYGIFQDQPVDIDAFNSTFDSFDACLLYYSANGTQSPTTGVPQMRTGRVIGNTFTNCRNTMLIEQIGVDTIRNNHIVMSSGGDGIFIYRPGQTPATTRPIVVTDNVIEGHSPTGNPAAYTSWGIGWAILDAGGLSGITDVVQRNEISGAFAGLDLQTYSATSSVAATDNRITNTYVAIMKNSGGGILVANGNDIVGYTFPVAAGPFRVPLFVASTPALAVGSVTCNWWGSASGPIGMAAAVPTGAYTPWAVGPIANGAGGACTGGLAPSNTWASLTSIPLARAYPAAEVIGGIMYVAGGHNGTRDDPSLQAYNPASDTWQQLAPMPGGRYEGDGAGVINGELYVAGGWTTSPGLPNNTLFIYTPSSNSWRSAASMPTLSACGGSGVINNKLYVTTACDGFSGYRNLLHVYDPSTNTWTALAPSTNIHSIPATGVIDGKFYVAGGFDGSATSTTLEVYDPATNTWTTRAPMTVPREGASGAVVNGKLYISGGVNALGGVSTVEVYDPVANTWATLASMPASRWGMGTGVVAGFIYVASGVDVSGIVGTVDVYRP